MSGRNGSDENAGQATGRIRPQSDRAALSDTVPAKAGFETVERKINELAAMASEIRVKLKLGKMSVAHGSDAAVAAKAALEKIDAALKGEEVTPGAIKAARKALLESSDKLVAMYVKDPDPTLEELDAARAECQAARE